MDKINVVAKETLHILTGISVKLMEARHLHEDEAIKTIAGWLKAANNNVNKIVVATEGEAPPAPEIIELKIRCAKCMKNNDIKIHKADKSNVTFTYKCDHCKKLTFISDNLLVV